MNSKMVAYAGLLVAIQAFLFAVESWLTTNDLGTPTELHWIKAIAGGVIVLGTAVGGVFVAFQKLAATRTEAVNAALNLVASGEAVDVHGNPTPMGPEATPFKPATAESAQKIVSDYGPVVAVK